MLYNNYLTGFIKAATLLGKNPITLYKKAAPLKQLISYAGKAATRGAKTNAVRAAVRGASKRGAKNSLRLMRKLAPTAAPRSVSTSTTALVPYSGVTRGAATPALSLGMTPASYSVMNPRAAMLMRQSSLGGAVTPRLGPVRNAITPYVQRPPATLTGRTVRPLTGPAPKSTSKILEPEVLDPINKVRPKMHSGRAKDVVDAEYTMKSPSSANIQRAKNTLARIRQEHQNRITGSLTPAGTPVSAPTAAPAAAPVAAPAAAPVTAPAAAPAAAPVASPAAATGVSGANEAVQARKSNRLIPGLLGFGGGYFLGSRNKNNSVNAQ